MTQEPDAPAPDAATPLEPQETLLFRLIYMVLLGFMISIAQTILVAVAVVQFAILLLNRREPNARLAAFGVLIGSWVAAAARYLSAATDAKPWPWREMD